MDLLTFSGLLVACLPIIIRICISSKRWDEYSLDRRVKKGMRIRDKEGNVFVVVEHWSMLPQYRRGRNIAGVYAVPEGGKDWVKFDLFDFEKGRVKIL